MLDAIIDVLKLLPFLFLSFVIMELIEHKLNNEKKLQKTKKYGPVLGSVLGIVPQCGFSTLASNLYAARVITLGTLFSVYLSTSDEMLPLLISHHENIKNIIYILFVKFAIGLIFGILVDMIYHKKDKNEIGHLCEEEHCHCEKEGIIKSSIIHTLKIALFILIINVLLNTIIDPEKIKHFAYTNKVLAPVVTSLIGLIPNCAASVIVTELYLDKIISFGSCLSGLLASSGVGILVLFRQNKHFMENIIITILLILIASICGILFNLIW